MNSKSLRRLAAEHANLHNQPLPPNYFFPPQSNHSDDLTSLDVLLAGPDHTPFSAGVWKLHLSIPSNYPETPPTAHFFTPIFHPNVDPQTGGVCVETLKRDWDSKLTLRDVLVTISCLLIQPNPDSALNAEAGALIQEGYDAFARRAVLMTSIQAKVHTDLKDSAREAQRRGQETEALPEDGSDMGSADEVGLRPRQQPVRQRRTTRRTRGTVAPRRSNGSPSETSVRSRLRAATKRSADRPFVYQAGNDDVFGFGSIPPPQDNGTSRHPQQSQTSTEWDDSTMMDINQENDETRSPSKFMVASPSKNPTPRRPQGTPVPLGELTIADADYYSTSSDDMEPEYPPSPKKSPSKSPVKRQQQPQRRLLFDVGERGEGSRDAILRAPHLTPPNVTETPLVDDPEASFQKPSPSPRKGRQQQRIGVFESGSVKGRKGGSGLFGSYTAKGIVENIGSPKRDDIGDENAQKAGELDSQLWEACGGDLNRWNRGDFDGEPFKRTAGRW